MARTTVTTATIRRITCRLLTSLRRSYDGVVIAPSDLGPNTDRAAALLEVMGRGP